MLPVSTPFQDHLKYHNLPEPPAATQANNSLTYQRSQLLSSLPRQNLLCFEINCCSFPKSQCLLPLFGLSRTSGKHPSQPKSTMWCLALAGRKQISVHHAIMGSNPCLAPGQLNYLQLFAIKSKVSNSDQILP